ncbi:MAG: preprotein translocase subunit YajC [Limisphaerales bacterium]
MHLNTMLAQAATTPTTSTATPGTPTGQAPSGMDAILHSPMPMFVLMAIVFYFLLIRPQQKRAKELAKLVSSIKAGDKVVTASGIIGVVTSVKDRTVALRSGDAKMEVTKASVTEILEASTPTEA